MKSIALVLGTRPEIIKLAPLVPALRRGGFTPRIISTGQHQEMADQAFRIFGLSADLSLQCMRPNQTPFEFFSRSLPLLQGALETERPCGVLVQGDTTSALAGAMAAYHLQIPIGHVEAGLRTENRFSPFPEEMNRRVISQLSSVNFCPTPSALENLSREGLSAHSYVVGNTVIDALVEIRRQLKEKRLTPSPEVSQLVAACGSDKIVLVTGHRRESLDGPLAKLCDALRMVVERDPVVRIVFPVHLNPQVRRTVFDRLGETDRIHLIEPVDYCSLLYLIGHSALIVTDSGGIQEEAPSFGVPVLVTRMLTERAEAIESGCAELCPLDNTKRITDQVLQGLARQWAFPARNPFGDGQSSDRIANILAEQWVAPSKLVANRP